MRTDMITSMRLAGENLLNCLCPEKNYAPYWEMIISPELKAHYNMWWPQHNLGRWWDAMLRLENETGFVIPANIEGAMLQNIYDFFDNDDNLCFQPKSFTGKLFQLEMHSLREGLIALTSLVRFRGSRWAADKGHKMLESIERLLASDFSWNLSDIEFYKGSEYSHSDLLFDATGTHGRLIEAIIWFYESTGDCLALTLAGKLAEWHLENSTLASGAMNLKYPVSHTHSYLGMLRGLFLYGKLTGQRNYIDRVSVTYDKTVLSLVKESGYTSHDVGLEERGETTSGGDAAQLAMWLAADGRDDLFDDTERIVKARILPSQIVTEEKLISDSCEQNDYYRNLPQRAIGGFGGMHKHPHGGKMNTTDITAADLHTLIDVTQNIAVVKSGCIYVNMHLDCDCSAAIVRSLKGKLSVTADRNKPLRIRMNRYIPRDSITISIGGAKSEFNMRGDWITLESTRVSDDVQVSYATPKRVTKEITDGVEYIFSWEGNEIISVSPTPEYLSFY